VGEIVEQALHILAGEDLEGRTPNLVYMGMGEPFLNYDAVVRSIRLLMREDGLNVGARRITVSTVGVVPGIKQFAREGWQVRLAISLHAANDALRLRLVPFNRQYRIADIMRAVRDYILATGRQVSFEWVLFKGVNDSQNDARELADLIAGMKAIVNVIPYNAAEGAKFSAPTYAGAQAFCDGLTRRGIRATLRKERGQEINAACGQLRSRHSAEATR
jgi:23S rRNA (adenine2503-C2)-methyltransferase